MFLSHIEEGLDFSFKWIDSSGDNMEIFVDEICVVKTSNNKKALHVNNKIFHNGCIIDIKLSKAIINGIEMIDSGVCNIKGFLLVIDEKEDGFYLRVVSELEKHLLIEDENELMELGISYKLPKSFEAWCEGKLIEGAKQIEKNSEIAFNNFCLEDNIVDIYVIVPIGKDKKPKFIISTENKLAKHHPYFSCINERFKDVLKKDWKLILKDFLIKKDVVKSYFETFHYGVKFSKVKEIIDEIQG